MTPVSSLVSQSQRICVDRKQQAIKPEGCHVKSGRVKTPPISESRGNKRITVEREISLNQGSDKEQSVVASCRTLPIVLVVIVSLTRFIQRHVVFR